MAIERSKFESQSPIEKIFAQYEETKSESGVIEALVQLQNTLKPLKTFNTPQKVDMLRSRALAAQQDPANASDENLKLSLKERLTFYAEVEATHHRDQSFTKSPLIRLVKAEKKSQKRRYGLGK